jgi:hypothetical protein
MACCERRHIPRSEYTNADDNSFFGGRYMRNFISFSKALTVVAITVATASVHAATPIGGPVINPANNHSYYVLSESTWQDAEATAVSLGGHLATINDASEQAWVFTTFEAQTRNLWIGLFRSDVSSPFQWASGEAVTYTNWLSGQPDSNVPAPENYVHMIATANGFDPAIAGFWNDLRSPNTGYPQLSPLHGVVEVSAVPEPSTSLMFGAGLVSLFMWGRRRKGDHGARAQTLNTDNVEGTP